jgi:hypothetical protein
VRRALAIALALGLVALAAATIALAAVREYGLEPDPRPKADCPGTPCRATGRVTGFQVQTLRDGRKAKFTTRVRHRNGWLVAFSVTLGNPTRSQRDFFDGLWGKPATARISVLRPAPTEKYPRNRIQNYRLVGQSETRELNDYFGTKAWFTLGKRMHVRKKDILALTIPTWAPVLATDLSPKERWRGSRKFGKCNNARRPSSHEDVGSEKRYQCLYDTSRLLYTALVVEKPKPAKQSR